MLRISVDMIICDIIVCVQAISLDFLGVPGSEVASKTANLIEQHGFPSDKRLGAGVVDGRSVWADGETPSTFIAALQSKARFPKHSAQNQDSMTLICWCG